MMYCRISYLANTISVVPILGFAYNSDTDIIGN